MSKPRIKETLVYKKEILLKSAAESQLDEREYLFSKTVYGDKDKVMSEIHYDAEGNITQEYVFGYDNNGFLREELMKEDDGFVAEHKTWEPDEKARIAKELRHYMDGSFDTVTYSYNDQGLVSKKVTVDPDGDTESVEEFDYSGGNLTRYTLKNEEGEILSERKVMYDEKGNPVEVHEYDGSEGLSNRKVIEYYPSGNRKETLLYNDAGKLVEKTVMKENEKGQLVQTIEETHSKKNTVNFTFDNEGNIICQEEFDRNGELVSRVNRTYDENQMLLTSDVFIHGAGRGPSRNYTLRQEYVFG